MMKGQVALNPITIRIIFHDTVLQKNKHYYFKYLQPIRKLRNNKITKGIKTINKNRFSSENIVKGKDK